MLHESTTASARAIRPLISWHDPPVIHHATKMYGTFPDLSVLNELLCRLYCFIKFPNTCTLILAQDIHLQGFRLLTQFLKSHHQKTSQSVRIVASSGKTKYVTMVLATDASKWLKFTTAYRQSIRCLKSAGGKDAFMPYSCVHRKAVHTPNTLFQTHFQCVGQSRHQ